MRITLFHTTLPEPGRKLGGTEVAVHRLANALASSGEDRVIVYSLTPRQPDAQYVHHELFKYLPWLGRHQLTRLFLLPVLLNFVPFEGDLIHLHGDDWFYILRLQPTIRTFHGSALNEARSATSWRRTILQYAVYPLEHLAARLCNRALAIGRETASIYGTNDVMDLGVDIDLFHAGPKSISPRVLFVGTWAGRKRGNFVFDIFTRLVVPVFPDAKLCMVSDQCAAHPSVIAEPFPSDEVLAQRYRESWVFAYPSTYEGFGIPYLEALASGTAILCSPNEGADYVLAQGQYGIIASDDAFGERLIELISSSALRDELARRGRPRAEEFSWSATAARHRTIYQELLNS